MNDITQPVWWKVLTSQYQQGVGRVFILHDNVNDVAYYPGFSDKDLYLLGPRPFRDMLIYFLAGQLRQPLDEKSEPLPFAPVFYASPTFPLTLYYLYYEDKIKDNMLKSVYVEQKKLAREMTNIREIEEHKRAEYVESFPEKIRSSPGSEIQENDIASLLFAMSPYLEQFDTNWFPVILVLDFFEKITTQSEQRANYVTEEIIRRWALSDKIKKSRNMVIGLTVDLNALPELLKKSDSQIQTIQIPMPDREERRSFLTYWQNPIGYDNPLKIEISHLDPSDRSSASNQPSDSENQDKQLDELAALTRGFRLLNLETMVRLAKVEGHEGKIDQSLFKRHKAKVIKEESFELLQEIPPKRGFEAIGGLGYAKDYFMGIAEQILKAQVDSAFERSIPKGILLVGPPGTGKTILAEALAAQGKMTLVRMGDIRGRYVGQSEQNMTRALKLLEELSPVVVFVDEIDQSIGRRTTGHEGDSGVNRRIFGKMLEFMGDNRYRGKILWIGASNRPDLLDEAMISRFDTVMAILPPYALEERTHILKVMENNVNVTFSEDIHNNIGSFAAAVENLSGRAIETIVRKAADLADRNDVQAEHLEKAISLYKPNTDIHEIDIQTLHALIATNFMDMMPVDKKHYPDRLWTFVEEAIEQKSNQPLIHCLNQTIEKKRR
ncbi:MAG: ATP-binding protein [Desulfotignum sp.]|nr:ATP-binding protein [Desulfotignum sp.]